MAWVGANTSPNNSGVNNLAVSSQSVSPSKGYWGLTQLLKPPLDSGVYSRPYTCPGAKK